MEGLRLCRLGVVLDWPKGSVLVVAFPFIRGACGKVCALLGGSIVSTYFLAVFVASEIKGALRRSLSAET